MPRVPLVAAAATGCAALAAAQPAVALTVTLDLTGGTASQVQAFNDAADFWSSVLGARTASGVSETLLITAQIAPIDGSGGTLASAGPTAGQFFQTQQLLYATEGVMNFDSADLAALEADDEFLAVVVHEMAHVIGFGTLWGFELNGTVYNDVYDDAGTTSFINGDEVGQYYGPAALAAYQAEYDPTATFVPVELDGGAGTAHGHWDENWHDDASSIFELLTGFLHSPVDVSYVTLAQFADLGYEIATELEFEQALTTLNINNLEVADVPLPGAAPLALSGLLALGLIGRRRRG